MNGELSGWNGEVTVYFKIIFSEEVRKTIKHFIAISAPLKVNL
jgi:hypothetical protein